MGNITLLYQFGVKGCETCSIVIHYAGGVDRSTCIVEYVELHDCSLSGLEVLKLDWKWTRYTRS